MEAAEKEKYRTVEERLVVIEFELGLRSTIVTRRSQRWYLSKQL